MPQIIKTLAIAGLALLAGGCANSPFANTFPFARSHRPSIITLPARYPGTHLLASNALVVEVLDPAATSQLAAAQRVAPLAWIVRAQFQGHEVLADVPVTASSAAPVGLGLEFDAANPDGPPGFVAAAVGATYLKVGVGEFRKVSMTYDPAQPGPLVQRFPTTVSWDDGEATFTQESTTVSGQHYALKVHLLLRDNRLLLVHTLHNAGKLPLVTEVTVGNGFAFDQASVGPGWIVTLPYAPTVSQLPAAFVIAGQELRLGAALSSPLQFIVTAAAGQSDAGWVGVTSTAQCLHAYSRCSVPLARLDITAGPHLLAPAQVARLTVMPAADLNWTQTYVFSQQSGVHAP